MSSTTKIILGALATILLAWIFHGPMGFGARCSGGKPASSALIAPEPVVTAPVAVTTCQASVDAAIKDQTVQFASGGSGVAPESLALIESVAKSLKDCDGVTIEVAGHTDITGGAAANQALSERRASSVVAALVQRGVAPGRLTAKGFGATQPLDPNTSPEANTKNRRIEFHVASAPAVRPAQ